MIIDLIKGDSKHIIGKDKLYHLFACLVIALYSTEASITAALTKEYADKTNYGHWCWWDICADSIGIIIGTIIRILIINRWNWI